MGNSVTEVVQTRSVLHTLEDRPDHEAVDATRARIIKVEPELSRRLEEIVRAPRPDEVDRLQWRADQAEQEKEHRAKALRETIACKPMIQLDEMHDAYERLLKDAEERLEHMYGVDVGEGSAKEGRSASAGPPLHWPHPSSFPSTPLHRPHPFASAGPHRLEQNEQSKTLCLCLCW